MPKRKCEEDIDYYEMYEYDIEESLLPRTPARNKRIRRCSDVIDCMGELNSPAANSASTPRSTPASTGFVTPQRSRAYWNYAASPDTGYSSTPELVRSSYAPGWSNKVDDTHDATVPEPDESNFTYSQVDPTAKMSSQKDDDCYNMGHRKRGKCIIFNHEHFDTGFDSRDGSSADARRLEQSFQNLGFEVEVCDDYEHNSIMTKIAELSDEDHTDSDCVCIFVLTHGLRNDFICAKDVAYKLDNIWKPFTADRCTTLAGKPKLFFFQACRGDSLDGGVTMFRAGTSETDSSTNSYKIPTHADFLFAYSTVQGFYSWRNPVEGTWYVQSLCEILDKYSATTHLTDMLTLTARKVATDFASYNNVDSTYHDQKQVPSITSMLIRNLYFTPKNE